MDSKIFIKSITILLVTYFSLQRMLAFSQCPPNAGPQTGRYGKGGDTASNRKDYNFFEWKVFVRGSKDPNQMVGSFGYDSVKWVSVNDRMNYAVHFENDPKVATAPAQNVFLHLPVDSKININSLQLGDIGFGKFKFAILPGSSFYSSRLDLRDSMGLFVDLTAGIDVINNEVFWLFRSIDPATGLPPADPLKGFLPINDTIRVDSVMGKGEGFVSFTIKPLSTDQTGDTVSEKASIIFDVNEPIPTNSWVNKIDAVAPVSKINSVSVFMDTVTLHWSGVDDVHGSGIKDYAFYYSENNGPFVLYQKNISDTTIQFVGTPGKTYCFYTIAADNTNNKENFKSSCDGSAFLPISGAALPITWLYFNGRDIGKDALLNWATTSEINSKFFGVERSVDGINFTSIGNVTAAGNSSITTNYNFVDSNAMNLPASELYYRLKQVDIDGRSTYSIIITIKIYHNNIEPQITAYPNPFTQNITLRVMAVSATDQTDNVTLYNVDGKMLYKKKVVQRGNATILLEDIPTLNRGIYLLTVSINKKQYTIKMVRK